jgi:YegS/Rv2252/BmrU family lipid kinase
VKPLIIINNAAARARRAWPVIKSQLEQAGIAYDAVETTAPGDATHVARDAFANRCQLIAVVGGDGTLSEAAAGYFAAFDASDDNRPTPINAEAALAILPSGTGDDFARTLIGQREPLAYWINVLVDYCQNPKHENTKLVDAIRVRTDSYTRPVICLNASTLGLGGETATRVAAQGETIRKLSGELRFAAAAVGALAAWREKPTRVTINKSVLIERPMNLVAVANARFAGGGMMLSPTAELNDAQFDVVTASGLNRAGILREMTRIHRGGHVANPKVRIDKATEVTIETVSPDDALLIEVDGNVSGRTPADYRIMPAVLRVVRPT